MLIGSQLVWFYLFVNYASCEYIKMIRTNTKLDEFHATRQNSKNSKFNWKSKQDIVEQYEGRARITAFGLGRGSRRRGYSAQGLGLLQVQCVINEQFALISCIHTHTHRLTKAQPLSHTHTQMYTACCRRGNWTQSSAQMTSYGAKARMLYPSLYWNIANL